jgi:hypothetical protein
LIDFYIINQNLCTDYTETHHILPISLFPKLKKEKSNMIKLPYKAHYIAHWLLAKGTNTYEMIAAFNGMGNRNKNKCDVNSAILYDAGKKMFSDSQMGEKNIGYKMVSAWNKIIHERVRVTSEEFYSNRTTYGGITCKEAIEWKIIHEDYVPHKQPDSQKIIARISSLNTSPAKIFLTNESIGRVSKDDIRWDTGEIVSSNKGIKRKTGYKRPNKIKTNTQKS